MIQEENAEDEQPKNKGEVSKDTKSIKTECYEFYVGTMKYVCGSVYG